MFKSLLLLIAALLACSPASADESISADELAKVRAAEAARVAAIDQVYGAVVAIYGNDRGGGGSGVLYDPAGYALTNYHVVAGAGPEGWGGLADGKLYRWKLVGMDPGGDVAIIKLTGKDRFPVAPLGDSDTVRVGDFAMAMGNPFVLAEDQRPTVTLGIVSGVRRYQPGEGGATMLVYGNCIQVDSSINPGNSGGPLFNLASEVIGINGRGSFKERGRVNVGVGYAISIEQIKNFIPDLLATQTALHGTLEATFANRGGQVICERINLDAKIAELGLALGDWFVAFDGEPIEDANEYTNLISTIPAGWPVEVTFEHEGKRQTVWLRLPKLPYPIPKKKPQPVKKEDSKPSRSPRAPEPDSPKPELPKLPIPGLPGRPEQPKLPETEPGKIGDRAVNQREYRRVLDAWTNFAGGRAAIDAAKVIETVGDLLRGGKGVGTYRMVVAADGRFFVEYNLDGKYHDASYDGQRYIVRGESPAGGSSSPSDVIADPLAAAALSLARLLKTDGFVSGMAHYELQGSDRAQRERAYRLRASLVGDEDVFLWFSLTDADGAGQTRLLKTAAGEDGTDIDPAVTYHDYREVGGVRFPHRLRVVAGLDEKEKLEAVANSSRAIDNFEAAAFPPPVAP